ncbi:hypothetical protein K440DRAFT_663189 [Wilcoxina mikolae CBS 423.85]|nr:hypothetical protein K440DRAFT_663189 [Wilcoxina mikolae CBS 423.85]
MTSSVIEKELTCSICTEILFDPITLLNCLHHNCGACAKQWFSSQQHTAPTCPVCRRLVKGAGVSPIVVSILEDFLKRYPERGRTPEEIEEMRGVWKPGQDVLPATVILGDEVVERRILRPPPMLQRVRAPRSNSDPPPSPHDRQLLLSPRVERTPPPRTPTSPRLPLTRPPPPPGEAILPLPYHHPPRHRPRSPPPQTLPARRPSLPPPVSSTSSLASVLEILQHGTSPIIITCDHCCRRLDSSAHHECSGGCRLFHLCLRCFRAGQTCPSPQHPLTRQQLISSWPRRYLQVGIFCDVCDTWLDEDRNSIARCDSMFWCCKTCNDGAGWNFCTRCIARGWNCTHELEVWTNSRSSATQTQGGTLIRGIPSAAPLGIPSPEDALLSLGYHPWLWTDYATICTLCKLEISPPRDTQWLHCYGCPSGHGDLCTTCFYNLHRTFPSPSRGMHSFYLCPRGHAMAVLAQPGKKVLHRGVFAHAPKPRAPEWLRGRRGVRAVALRGHWPEEQEGEEGVEGERKWGRGQWLCFPKDAELLDVVVAFEEPMGEVEWCWGSYAGVGGLFPRVYVDFT